jgi:alkylation response protein AidB-like acyl-CoA dehydrogenase
LGQGRSTSTWRRQAGSCSARVGPGVDAKITQIYEGINQIQLTVMAWQLLK